MFNEDQQTDDRQALAREVVPRTLRSLFVLRITLLRCRRRAGGGQDHPVAAFLAAFWIDLLTNTPNDSEHLSTWMHAADLVISGLLASVLALIIATFLIQARVLGYVGSDSSTAGGAR